VTAARLVALRVVDTAKEHLSVGEVHGRMLEQMPLVNSCAV